ncbi:hypothetical protein [Woodsholea maritima]|uniref:hypothetical protein n=1 Tax=Woodsholea maritima TaxID=240237 RepID=UPI000381BE9F|nr:hypothetical protein [Woodsholea maritima]
MSIATIGRVMAVATVFIAAPAIADNSSYGNRYYKTPLEACLNETTGALELRACLSRRLLEAERSFDLAAEALNAVVSREDNETERARRMEALGFSRETWRNYLEFQCEFEGAVKGDSWTEIGPESSSCRIELLEAQAHRLNSVLRDIAPNGDYPTIPGPCSGSYCPSDTQTFRDWTATCRSGGACVTEATAGRRNVDHRLRLEVDRAGSGYSLVFLSHSHPIDANLPISVRVDGRNLEVFRASGSREDGFFEVRDPRAVSRLIDRMRRGGRLTVQYVDVHGADRLATFSLYGVVDSLEWIDSRGGYRPY